MSGRPRGRDAFKQWLIAFCMSCGAPTAPIVVVVQPVTASAIEASGPAVVTRPKNAEADQLFAEGKRLSRKGDFATALGRLRLSQELLPRDEAQYEIAFALEKLDRRAEAIEAYETYVRTSDLSHSDRISIELKVETLKASP